MKDMSEMSPEARSLIGEARALDGPTDEDRARVKRHVLAAIAGGAGVATSAVAGSAAASSAAAAGTVAAGTTATSLGVKVVIALIVATAALTTTYAVTHEPEPEPAEAPIPAAPEPELIVDVPAPARSEARPEVEEAAVEEAVEPEPSAARPRRAPRAVRPPTQPAQPAQAPVATPTALSGEVALLRRAQRSMNSGDPGAALRSLEEHARRFPSGHMEEEREAARVVALCRAGRATEARAIASRFLAERPASPLAARVRAACP